MKTHFTVTLLLLLSIISSILPLMALNSLYCADVPLSNYSLTHSLIAECTVARSPSGTSSFEYQSHINVK